MGRKKKSEANVEILNTDIQVLNIGSEEKKHYCTKKALLAEMYKWRDSNKEEEDKLYQWWLETYKTDEEREEHPFKDFIDYNKRTISEELGTMMRLIAWKLTNHISFRRYTIWDKEDMVGYASLKMVTGIKNYDFKYNNPFAYFTQSCFNSFKSVLAKHYKQINIKRSMVEKIIADFQSEMPGSSIEKSLSNQINNNEYAGMNGD